MCSSDLLSAYGKKEIDIRKLEAKVRANHLPEIREYLRTDCYSLFDMISEQNARTRMLIVNKAGHFHYREYPDEWVRNVLNFLSYWQ